jgi:hypothetical protein
MATRTRWVKFRWRTPDEKPKHDGPGRPEGSKTVYAQRSMQVWLTVEACRARNPKIKSIKQICELIADGGGMQAVAIDGDNARVENRIDTATHLRNTYLKARKLVNSDAESRAVMQDMLNDMLGRPRANTIVAQGFRRR